MADGATVAAIVDMLVREGWAVAGVDVTLTTAGVEPHRDMHRAVSEIRSRLTAGLTPQRYQATVDTLRQMAANLGWRDV